MLSPRGPGRIRTVITFFGGIGYYEMGSACHRSSLGNVLTEKTRLVALGDHRLQKYPAIPGAISRGGCGIH